MWRTYTDSLSCNKGKRLSSSFPCGIYPGLLPLPFERVKVLELCQIKYTTWVHCHPRCCRKHCGFNSSFLLGSWVGQVYSSSCCAMFHLLVQICLLTWVFIAALSGIMISCEMACLFFFFLSTSKDEALEWVAQPVVFLCREAQVVNWKFWVCFLWLWEKGSVCCWWCVPDKSKQRKKNLHLFWLFMLVKNSEKSIK